MSMSSKYLLIKAKGGMGNRILSAITGLAYADLTGRKAVIDWRDGVYAKPGINAYPMLFESPAMALPETLADAAVVSPSIWRGHLDLPPEEMIDRYDPNRHSDPLIYRKYCVDLTMRDTTSEVVVYWSYVSKLARLSKLMRQDTQFSDKSLGDITRHYLQTYFTPKPDVLAQVQQAVPVGGGPLLGVHIRQTDVKAPLGGLINRLAALRGRQPDADIFLATDNQHVESQIKTRFDRVRTIAKTYPADGSPLHKGTETSGRLTEAKSALADMWALASCDRLVFASSSTFSLVSYFLGKFDRSNSDDVDGGKVKHMLKRLVRDYA